MTQASDFLSSQVIDGTANQLESVPDYLNMVVDAVGYIGESENNGNEVMTFSDASVIIKIDDEASDYDREEDYR